MSDLLVIIPSRGRPDNVLKVHEAINATMHADTEVMFGFDLDDPTITEPFLDELQRRTIQFSMGERSKPGMVACLNEIALDLIDVAEHVGFMGDDHRPVTPGWDLAVCQALDGLATGIVYGNDLVQRENLPTAVFMTPNIVTALGYMAPPDLTRLFAGNAWKAWGKESGRMRYLEWIFIEYQGGRWWPLEADRLAWSNYVGGGQLGRDVAKISGLSGHPVRY